MEQDNSVPQQDTQEIALGLWSQAQDFALGLLRPWNAYQVGIAVGLFVAAHLLSRLLAPRLHEWMRTREGWRNGACVFWYWFTGGCG